MIEVTERAAEELGKYKGVLRIELRTAGCCEPTLVAYWDLPRPGDVQAKVGQLTVSVDPDTLRVGGAVKVDLGLHGDPPTLMLTSANPLSEWAGLSDTMIEGAPPEKG